MGCQSQRRPRRTTRWPAGRSHDARLRGFAELRDVVAYANQRGHAERSDEVLAALAVLAPTDPLAARALLQAVLYGLIRIAVDLCTAAPSEEDAASTVVAAAWERIRTYPIERRPRSIAANILLDTRQAVSRSLCRRRVREVLAERVPFDEPGDETVSATEELLDLVEEAVRMRHLRPDEAQLIVLTRVADVPFAQLAEEQGTLPQTLRRRRLRAEAALADAVA